MKQHIYLCTFLLAFWAVHTSGRKFFTTGEIAGQGYQEVVPPGPRVRPFFVDGFGNSQVQFGITDTGAAYVWSTADPSYSLADPINGVNQTILTSLSQITRLTGVANELFGQTIESITGCLDGCIYQNIFIKTYSGLVYSHGNGYQGSLGNQVIGTSTVWVPTRVNWPAPFNTKEAVQVAASDATTVVLFTDGTAVVAGSNSQYQLCETTLNIITPRAHVLSNLRAVYASPVHNAYVVGNGSIYFCGSQSFGSFANAATTNTRYSVPILGSFSAGTSFVSMRLFAGFGVGLTASRQVITWGSNFTGEAGVRGTGIGPRSVSFGLGFTPISVSASQNSGITVFAVVTSSLSGGRFILAWGYNPDMIIRPGSGLSLPTPTMFTYPSTSQMVGKTFAFVSGGISHMEIFTTDGQVYQYPALYGNIIDTHKVVPPSDTILDIYAAVNGGMWVGVSSQKNLYLATSQPTYMLPSGGNTIVPHPTLIPLPNGLKVKRCVIDQVQVGMSSYELIAVIASDNQIWTIGQPYQNTWSVLPFLQGQNITHLETTSMGFIAAVNSRDIYFYDLGNMLSLPGPSPFAADMSAVPSHIRWTKIVYSCYETATNDGWYCSHGPAAFLLANNGSVWAVGISAPYWSFNPVGGQNFNITRFANGPLYSNLVFVDIGVGQYGLFLIDSDGQIWGATDGTDLNILPLYPQGNFVAERIVSVSVAACGATFIGESGTPWVTNISAAACRALPSNQNPPYPPAEYDNPVPQLVDGMQYRRVKKAVATGTSKGHGALYLADFEVDWDNSLTRSEVPIGANLLQFNMIGLPSESDFAGLQGVLNGSTINYCSINSSRAGALHHFVSLPFQPWVVICDLNRPLDSALGPADFVATTMDPKTSQPLEPTSYTTDNRMTIVPAPTITDRTDLKTPSNAPSITIYGQNLGYFNYNNGSDILAVKFGDMQNILGDCTVLYSDGNSLICSPQQSLPFGILRVQVFRFGSPSPFSAAITITDAPNIISSPSRLIPHNAVFVRISVQYINTDRSDLVIRYYWKEDVRRKNEWSCNATQLVQEQDPTVVTITCKRSNTTNEFDLGVWEVVKQGGPSRTFELGIPTNATQVISPSSLTRIAASTKTFSIPGIGFGEDVRDVAVQLVIATAKRATFTVSCTPTFASNDFIRCDVSDSDLPLPVGALSASVNAYGVNSSSASIGVIVDAPVISTPTPTPIRASNAPYVLIYGSNFDPVPGANAVTLSSGTVNCTKFVGSALHCSFLSQPAIGDLRATIVAFGGTTGAPKLIAVIQSPPTVSSTASVILNPGATVITIEGSNFDPSFTNVSLNLRGLYDFNCLARPAETTATKIVCDIDNGGSLNATGSLTAVVTSYGGSSGTPVVVASVDSPPSASQSGSDSNSSALAPNAVTGISVSVAVVALLLIVVAILLIIRMRRRAADRANQLELDDSMRKQLNIQASEIQVLNKLGEGSFGAVYLGKYNKQFVAIKRLTASVLSSQIAEFFREASLMLSIKQHPNVVKIYGMCQELRNLSLVMEFLSGGSLDGYVAGLKERGERINEGVLWRIVAGIAAGMQSLSAQHIVHRDLAARNILLDSQLEPRVSDFGFSRVVGDDEKQGKTNATVGPIKWMPPESLRDRIYSEKSDVWAFGVTILEIVTAEDPYPGKDLLQIATGVRDGGLTPEDQIPKDCPDYLRELMEMCWAQQPSDRPTFSDIVAYLDNHVPAGVSKKVREVIEHQSNVTTSTSKKHKDKDKDGKYSEM
eukprot:TRINITY_DN4092_c0_g1_i1.p1 TRINITY_DN4092_c0_g1~~TRINITY_DN4092_c0_g1_i1.p1  ORF type:complete len:1750 (-),score=239.11 TRINITY_DN4092_c0_g1_i1:2239-7488(-)